MASTGPHVVGVWKRLFRTFTERRQLCRVKASLGARLHRAADTCPVRLARHVCRGPVWERRHLSSALTSPVIKE